MRGLLVCIFLGKLKSIQAWGTGISSAYLCTKMSEKVCIKTGTEFGELAGHLLIINKALHGLHLLGKAFNQLMTNVLRSLGFEPSKAEPSIYMRRFPDLIKDLYEYIGSYIDELITVISDPEQFLKDLQKNLVHDFKLKGYKEVNFHLGCGFVCDRNDTLCMDAGKYFDKMCNNYSHLFPGSPISKKYRQPLETNDHPKLDVSAFCNKNDIEIYQLMIDYMQWAISIGRVDIQTIL